MLNYPGGLGVFGAKASIAKTEDGDENDYQATFNLKIDYTNQTKTELDWELWMVENEYDSLDAAGTTNCKLIEKQDENGKTKFWYSDKSTEEATANPTEDSGCKGEAIITKLRDNLSGTQIATGKIKNGTGSITKDTIEAADGEIKDNNLSKRVINTSDKKAKFYYLVVKYPNQDTDQATNDAGKDINVTLSLDGTPTSTLYKPAE